MKDAWVVCIGDYREETPERVYFSLLAAQEWVKGQGFEEPKVVYGAEWQGRTFVRGYEECIIVPVKVVEE